MADKNNLPNFRQRFKPPVTELVEEDRNKAFGENQFFGEQLSLLQELLTQIRANVQPEFDPTFVIKENMITPGGGQLKFGTRMFQYVIVNPTDVILQVGFGEASNLNQPYRYNVPASRVFVSPVSFFSQLTFGYASAPTQPALAFCYAYNRIIHTPGVYSLA